MLSAGLLLLWGGVAPETDSIVVAMMWAGLAVSVIASITRFMKAMDRAAIEKKNPYEFLFPVPRISVWVNLLLLAGATAALFAAGEPILAAALETYLVLRLVLWAGTFDIVGLKEGTENEGADSTETHGGAKLLQMLIVASALWLALGPLPFWAENMIVTAFWFMSSVMWIGGIAQSAALQVDGQKHVFQRGQLRNEARAPGAGKSLKVESVRSRRRWFLKWLWRVTVLIASWGLWAAGYSLLAGFYLLGAIFVLSANTLEKRLKEGDASQIDLFARAVHAVVHWPLVFVGVLLVIAIVLPVSVIEAIYYRITGKKRPLPVAGSERDERVRQARIRRAAASYRLRDAFDRPAGFVYFMSSEPHQHNHFLGPDGLLAGLGERAVARDYRKHVLETRNSFNWQWFEQEPEGALLHVNGISNMRRDLPFIALVPPHGKVLVFCLSEPYRARKRDGGAALAKAEAEIRDAIAAAFES